jgi:hypothetical protein
MRNRADVPGSREAVKADSVGLGPSPAPSPPSGHRRRRGYLGPDEPAASGTFGVTAGFLRVMARAANQAPAGPSYGGFGAVQGGSVRP